MNSIIYGVLTIWFLYSLYKYFSLFYCHQPISRFGSEPPSVEDDVDVWRYAIVSCMPETKRRRWWHHHSLGLCVLEPLMYASPKLLLTEGIDEGRNLQSPHTLTQS